MSLSERLRPQNLDQLIGQEHVKTALRSFAERGEWPNVFLFFGPPGTGKTTVAKILSAKIQPEPTYVHEINASANNKVDDARELEELSYCLPFNGKPRVIILNEFERFTAEAQGALKDPMEMSPAIWILTSNNPEKINSAIKSRAAAATFEFKPLTQDEIQTLVVRAVPQGANTPESEKHFAQEVPKVLYDRDVRCPREIYGVLEQRLAGVPLEECFHHSEHEPLYGSVAKAVIKGDWKGASGLLKQIKTADSRAMMSVVSAFLRNELLSCVSGPRADAISVCLTGLDQTGFADGVAYGGVCGLLYRCCKALSKS